MSLREVLSREPIRDKNGVLEFIEAEDDYCDNFGIQWNKYRPIQIDSVSGQSESHDRFFAETGWTPEEIKGKVLLDAGCGAGRFTEIALEAGARVVAVDISRSVFACRETVDRFGPDQYLIVRASIADLPFKPDAFDGIFTIGVLHHIPGTLDVLKRLVPLVRPGGRLATWIYIKRVPNTAWVFPRTWGRWLFSKRSNKTKLLASQILTTIFFPLGWVLSWFGRTGERLSQFLPYAARHQYGRGDLKRQWGYAVMDTFDWYGPTYEFTQRARDVIRVMKEAGLQDVRRLPARGMSIVGEQPASTHGTESE